ncbi:MAG: hypothetical protein HOD92_09550 [Deltaproteobacteria bacterium]|nr:hypothetical protein [Deltaproteobacteria bacterium]MBT4526305.1 hypothetical protein [Deltaproteobacteria bacterium]
MKWQEIRGKYPHQWLIVEAIDAHTKSGNRIVEQFSVVNTYVDSIKAMESYTLFHQASPDRELYVLSTDKEIVEIYERRWLGIRR